ncbi:MAG: DUF4834 family protein [Rikenellaceae bacterium]
MFNIIKGNLFWWIILFLAVVAPSFLFGAFQLVFAILAAFVVVILVGLIWVQWKVRQIQKRGGGAQQQYYRRYTGGERGGSSTSDSASGSGSQPDVKIFMGSNDKKISNDVGDYVDFEEVNNDKESK